MTEDDTFLRLSRPSFEQMRAIKPLVAGEDFFRSHGWTWIEYKEHWIEFIKRKQANYRIQNERMD